MKVEAHRVMFQNLLAGGGEMGALLRSHITEHGSPTSLSTIIAESQSLRTSLSILLTSQCPMYLAWGQNFIQFYNDAFRPVLSSIDHATALGQPASTYLANWTAIAPIFEQVMAEVKTIVQPNPRSPLTSNRPDLANHSTSYAPILDESGGVGGVLVTVIAPLPQEQAPQEQAPQEHNQATVASHRTERMLVEQNRLLQIVASGQPLDDCLAAVCGSISELNPNVRACFLLTNAQRSSFPRSITPDFPPSFGQGLKDAPINELAIGTCGTAVYCGEPITCADIAHDQHWAQPWRELCVAHGILACYSAPVLGVDRSPVGSLMLCFSEARLPSDWEHQLADFGTQVASIVFERDRINLVQRETETKYRNLFDSINQSCCLCEMLFDEQNQPIDYRILEVNPIFEAITGLPNAIGKTARELVPNLEAHWVETYSRVVQTGEPVRFEGQAATMNQWFGVNAFRVGKPENHQFAVLFTDISDRKQAEAHSRQTAEFNAFRVSLTDALRSLADPTEVQATASRLLGEYLGANRVAYFEVRGTDYVVERDYVNGAEALAGSYPIDSFGPRLLAAYRRGLTVSVANVQTDPNLTVAQRTAYAAIQIAAYVGIPLIKEGEFVAGLAIHTAQPRTWTQNEVALAEEVAERTWVAVERTRVEVALRDSENRFRLVVESAKEYAIITLDLQGRITSWNAGAQRLLSYKDTEILGCHGRIIFTPEDNEQEQAEWEMQTALTEGRAENERWHLRKDGSRFWGSGLMMQLQNETGTVQGFVKIMQDKTAQREAAQRFRLLYDTTSDLLAMEQPIDMIRNLFDKLAAQLDLHCYYNFMVEEQDHHSMLHLKSYEGISEADAAAIEWIEINQYVCGLAAQQRQQIVLDRSQIQVLPQAAFIAAHGVTAYAAQPLIFQGRLLGTLSFGSHTRSYFTTEETKLLQLSCDQMAIAIERSNLLKSIQQQAEQLQRANQVKDEFLAVLSHELRSPLNPILGWIRLLQNGKLNEVRRAEALKIIERNAKLQAQLIEDLLDISRIMQGKLSLALAAVNLTFVISAAVETVHLTAEAKQIEINLDLADVPPISGDAARLQQVVWNLLTNAIKFTPDGGRVEVKLESYEFSDLDSELSNSTQNSKLNAQNFQNYVQITVTDTGKGIAPDFLPYVFDYFQQEDGSTTRKFGGLGLGLAIVRQIVEMHGGTVQAKTAGENQGATFIVKLPLTNDQELAVQNRENNVGE